MKYGWININLLDLWSKPKYNSERTSQLLFGEPVIIKKAQNNYYLISQIDGYHGWVDCRFVSLLTKREYYNSLKKINTMVISSTAKIYTTGDKHPYFLYYGTKLPVSKMQNGLSKIIIPMQSDFFIKTGNLSPINKVIRSGVTGNKVIAEASRFVGVPYLWGGITIAGFDCSGFVQTILSRWGVTVPRDTKDQILVGTKIPRESIMIGDLLFFNRHVGFAMGKDKIIHSSLGGGGVRINSLNPQKPGYRCDLDKSFNQARRIICSN